MTSFRNLWIGVGVLVVFTVGFFFVGQRVWGDQAFAPNYAASMAGAGLGAALSLIVVMISFSITQQHRQKDLSPARFAFLRRQGERLWQAYIAFCDSMGVTSTTVAGATWNSADRGLWPDGSKASTLHELLKGRTAMFTGAPGMAKTVDLVDAYDDVFGAVSDTAIFEGEHGLAGDITEAWRHFGWASAEVDDFQRRIGWTAQNWPQISKAIEQTSESVSKALSSLGELGAKVRIE